MRHNSLFYTKIARFMGAIFLLTVLVGAGPSAKANAPQVQFAGSPTVGSAPLVVYFTAPSIDNSGVSLSSPEWNFGDGFGATGFSVTHVYTNNGTFNPTFQAFDTNGTTVNGYGPNVVVGPITGLVSNGGFETGSFYPWIETGSNDNVYISTDPLYVHSGTYGAQLGPKGGLGFITQSLATIPGTTYVLSFWLDSPDGKITNEFQVSMDNQLVMNATNLTNFGWSNFLFSVTASTTNTPLQFGFRNDPSWLGLDDIKVDALTVQPAAQTVECGSTAIFSVVSNSIPVISYQWYSIAFGFTNLLAGETNAILNMPNVSTGGPPQFIVVITTSGGSFTSAPVTLNVVDTTPPVITLNGSNPTYVLINSAYNEPGAFANDLCSGGASINTSGFVDTNQLGSYTITYSSTDINGNSTSVTRTVDVVIRNYENTILTTSNALGFWPFNSTFGPNSEIGNITGTLSGSAQLGGPGSGPSFVNLTTNTSVALNGVAAYVNTSLMGGLTNYDPYPQVSVIGWFKLSSLPSVSGHPYFIAGESQPTNDFSLLITTNNQIECLTGSGFTTLAPTPLSNFDLNLWHFVGAAYTSSQSCIIYFDGVPVATNTNPNNYQLNASNTFSMGASDTVGGENFAGSLADIAIFNRQLSSGEIANLYDVATKPISVAITSPTNGNAFFTNQIITVTATASAVNGLQGLSLYSGTNLLGSTASTNLTLTLTNLAAGSYPLTAVATDDANLSATSAVVHITVNVPGTSLIDFDLLDASAGPVSGATLANYLAGYGVTLNAVSNGTTVSVQADTNLLGGGLTVASSGDNLLVQTGTNGMVSYTLSFAQPYNFVSWTRTELIASGGGLVAPGWTAYAYDINGNLLSQTGERQVLSLTNIPAEIFRVAASNITSIVFTANNTLGVLPNLPLDDLLLSSNALGPIPQIVLTTNNVATGEPGQITLNASASEVGGALTQIAFFENENPAGIPTSVSGPSGTASLNVTSLAPGSYQFYATATDTNGQVTVSTAVTLVVSSVPGVAVINFDDPIQLNTSLGAIGGTNLSNYLSGYGVTISNATIGTRLEAINQNSFSGNELPLPSSEPNLFTQVGSTHAVSFSLNFATNLQRVIFTRAALLTNGPSSISHPAWTAHILDASGNELESVSEPLLYGSNNIPARTFTLVGNNIASLRFDSDSQQSAAFAAILLDDLVIDANSAVNPLSIGLNTSGGGVSPASITLTPSVSDSFGTNFYVAFYSGPTLIGTNTGGNSAYLWTNVLNGNFNLTAKVFDASGYALASSPATVAVTYSGSNSVPFVVNFDQPDATGGPITGTNLAAYLVTNGLSVSSNSTGSSAAIENEANVAGGGFVALSSLSNLLTQVGSNGPASFTVTFSNLLTSFTFTRPQLVASPSVSHPAWRAIAYDPLGQALGSVGESVTSSYTNVPAQNFTLSNGSIASVEFDSDGTGLTTFNSALLDDFVLTAGNSSNLPPAVLITNPAPNQLFVASTPITISAAVAPGTGSVTNLIFFYNGTNIAGTATTNPYSISWTAPSNGFYVLTAEVFNDSGLTNVSQPVNLTVGNGFAITSTPTNQTIALGSNATFTVTTSGTNVSYQWQFNGTNIPGANQSTYTVSNATLGAGGNYTVVAKTSTQTITSQPPAVLTVVLPPSITGTSSLNPVVNVGDTVTLSVTATDVGSFYFQWKLNGANIPNATNTFYTISNAQPLNSGNYQVVVGNAVAFTQSPTFTVAVNFAGGIPVTYNSTFSNAIFINPLVSPVIGNNSNSPTVGEIGTIAGKPAGRFLWYKWTAGFTGVISIGTQGSSFDTLLGVYTGSDVTSLTSVVEDDDSGGFFTSLASFNCVQGVTYYFAVAGFKGAAGNVVVGLPFGTGYRVLDPSSGDAVPVITQQPTNQIVNIGDTVTLAVSAANATSYQWFFDNAPVVGASSNVLVISNFPAGAVGNYYALAANSVGASQSESAVIEIASQAQNGTTNLPSTLTVDKFGDAVDLTSAGSTSHYRPEDGGGDIGGFTLSQSFSTVGATKEDGEPNHAGQPGGASYWYAYTAGAAGTIQFDTIGSTFNTILAIYKGSGASFSSLVSVGAGYTSNYTKFGQPVVLVSNLVADTKYFIAVDGYLGVSGAAHLNVALSPFTNTPSGAIPITNHNASFTMSAPQNNYLTTSSNIVVKGTVSGVIGVHEPLVSFVQVGVNTNQFGHAALVSTNFAPVLAPGPNGSEESVAEEAVAWSTNLVLVPGANIITAQSVSVQGSGQEDVTFPITRTVFYVTALPSPDIKSTLTLATNGHGKITGLANNAVLEVNKIYHVTAVPTGNWLFTNWTSGTNLTNLSVLPNGPSLSFVMASNLILQANFVTNPFTGLAGVYNGLFFPISGPTEQSSGYVTATVPASSRGTYSARIQVDGAAYPFSGTFNLGGDAQALISRGASSPLTVALHLNTSAVDDQLTGSITNNDTNNAWVSYIQADRVVFSAKNLNTNYDGKYNVIIPPDPSAPSNSPGGYGYATLANTTAGHVTVAGRLGDGTTINQSTTVSKDGNIPLYVSLYSGKGSLLGWLSITNNSSNIPPHAIYSTDVSWIKPAVKSGLYSAGFTNVDMTAVGAAYVAPVGHAAALALTNGTLTLAGGDLGTALIYTNLTVVNNKLVNGGSGNPTNKLTGVVTPSTGALTLTFRPTGARADVTARGVVVQDLMTTNGAGWFLGADESGSFLLEQ